MKLADRLQQAWYEGHAGLAALWPLEKLYRRVVQNKRRKFLAGELDSYRAPVPVIVVGNITVGGTGKTPLILWLVEYCQARGLRVGVVSRGYGGKAPEYPWRVRASDDPAQVGDEPSLLVRRTGVSLVVDPRRAQAVRLLLEQEALDLVLCDDGLQHYGLQRDLELVLIDAARGLGNGRCLPAGPLREPAERLQSVDAVLLNGGAEDSEQGYAMQLRPAALVHVASGESKPLGHFPAGQPVHAVAGIGNPQRFFRTLRELGWQPQEHPFADHARFVAEDLQFGDDLPVLMTEKDAVKCRSFAPEHAWYLQVEARPSPAFVHWLDERLTQLLAGRNDN